MSETLKTWFRTRLGVIIDLSPEIFGHYARDGTLMAKILHSYDIINDSQLSTIIHTHDPALCRVNLKHLKVWLRFIGIDCDNQSINEISTGKGCTALRLFYKLYLSLENKDRLHFITLQREREKFIPTSTKFDVTRVSEESSPKEPSENPLADPLVEKSETIQWYRQKRQEIIDACKQEREKFKEAQKLKSQETSVDEPVPKAKRAEMKQSELKDIDDFQRKHKFNTSYENYENPNKKRSRKDLKSSETMLDPVEQYLKKLKNRRDQQSTTKNFKERMQKLLLSEVWEKLLHDQETKFDEIIAKKVLIQSQYEKRIITNLCEIRQRKSKIAANRQIVENLMQNTRENEIIVDYKREREIRVRDQEEVENECERLCELQRRLRDEKIRRIKAKHEQTCLEIVSDLVDISIKAANYLEENDRCIPRTVWNNWKSLFIKGQPIFEPEDEEEEENEEEEIEEVTQLESKSENTLNNFDFETYHNIESPWDEYLPKMDDETEEILRLGLRVLGYIVHRLLEFLYPYPPDPEAAAIPKVEKRVILLGVPNRVLTTLQELLEQSEIKLVFMEDAINHCLKAYKEEMKNIEYINLGSIISNEVKVAKPTMSEKSKLLNKHVQTPKNVPFEDMDPILSDDAYIGKWTYDFLRLGEPISDQLNTKILIQYLKSLSNIKGWAIVDYPNNHEQMASLESALTGKRFNLQPFINLDSETEDLISTPSRITFEDENSDTFSIYRKSQLVPDPITKLDSHSETFMTGFIRVIAKQNESDEEIFEILSEDATPMDTFYAMQSVAYVLYYSTFDLLSVKRLARLIIGDMSLPRKSSSELFGESFKNLRAKTAIVKQLIPQTSETFSKYSAYGEGGEVTPEKSEQPLVIKPGEEAWEWVKFPQPDEVLEALAVLWENFEYLYVSNLKDVLFKKRKHSNAVIPYRSFLINHMRKFISRPDIKQEVFKPFYREFNAFDEEMRVDSEFKCELQCRVADLQAELFEICDQRKKESEEERQRLIETNWTALEAVALITFYINIAQIEIDRCIDTIQMLQDYYNSMLQKPLGSRFHKVLLQRLDSPVNKNVKKSIEVKSKSTKTKKKKTKGESILEPPAAVDCRLLENELKDVMLDVEKEECEVDQSICYNAIKVNIDYVKGVVDSLASSFRDMWKKEADSKKKSKGKKLRKPSVELASGDNLGKYHNLMEEWRYATFFEINRMKMRLKMLDNAVRTDINFLLGNIREVFHRLHKDLVDRYEREITSVNEMVNAFNLAIEEERSIKEEMFFKDDKFIIKTINIEELPLITEEILPFRFQIAQLGRLMDILHHAAPCGKISRRALFYILMDIITLGEEEEEVLFPSAWYQLENEQVCQIIQELFGCDCDSIEWREFIIYGFEISMPSVGQLLKARKTFAAFDSQLKEVITREQFHSVPIWFYKSTEIHPHCARILHGRDSNLEMDQGEENIYYNFERVTGIRLPSKMAKMYSEGEESSYVSFDEYEDITPEQTFRLMLVKELLSELFLTQKHFLNYMELLFAFCKDEDPRKGFGKALALYLGNRICTNVEDGEKYVSEVLKLKRRLVEENLSKEEIKEISQAIVEDLLESTVQHTEGVIIEEVFEQIDQDIFPGDQRLIQVQKQIDSKLEDSQQISLTGSNSTIQTLNDHLNIVTKDSMSTTLIGQKWICSPLASATEIELRNTRNLIHWIPKEVCLKVLTKGLKLFPGDIEALENIRVELDSVYKSLRDNELEHEENEVLSHRLVNHSFIRSLLTNISNFTTKNMSTEVSKIVNQE